jgi:hypothetical protein
MFDTRIFPSNNAQIAFGFVMGGHEGAGSWLAISPDSHWVGGWRLRQNCATLESAAKDPARGRVLLLVHEYQFKAFERMNREELERILDERTFNPFVLTTMDGFAIPVTDPHKALLESLKSKTGCRGVKFFPCSYTKYEVVCFSRIL